MPTEQRHKTTPTLHSDFVKARQKNRAICERVRSAPQSQLYPDSELGEELLKEHKDVPEALMLWGGRLLGKGHENEGIFFISTALQNAWDDRKPGIIFSKSIKILETHGLYQQAHEAMEIAVESIPHDIIFKNRLAVSLIKRNQPAEVLPLLEPEVENGRHNKYTLGILGTAYICNGQADRAIALLEPVHQSDEGDKTIDDILRKAYGEQDYTPDR